MMEPSIMEQNFSARKQVVALPNLPDMIKITTVGLMKTIPFSKIYGFGPKMQMAITNLFALGEKGIGAIYLANAPTQFAVKDAANNLEGEVKTSGLFVREDGSVGTVQQIDLAI